MNLEAIWSSIARSRVPILGDLLQASWPNWREALKELFVILFFSLMPLWLGLLIVTLLTITGSPSEFVTKFASSSDLGMLNKTNGFRALMSIFGQVYTHLAAPGQPVPASKFAEAFGHSSLKDADFNTERYKPGTSGEAKLRNDLVEELFGS